eukprot:1900892-Heterocapsa_arctica.AAC.1
MQTATGPDWTPLYGIRLRLGFCCNSAPTDDEDVLICRYAMLLINGDCESVLPFAEYDGQMAGVAGVAANQFHWESLLSYLRTKKQAGQVTNPGRFALDDFIEFEKRFLQVTGDASLGVFHAPGADRSGDQEMAQAEQDNWSELDESWMFPND